VIDASERGAIARVHAVGLLGVTVVGWLLAALISGVALNGAIRGRAALRTLQSAQAMLFQIAAFVLTALLLFLVALGFLLFGGAVDFLPELAPLDPFAFPGLVVLVLWIVVVLLVPAWYVMSLVLAWRATRASRAGEVYAYPVIGPLVWDSAPRYLRWLRVEGEETEELEEPEVAGPE
jgi:hypothetical protein